MAQTVLRNAVCDTPSQRENCCSGNVPEMPIDAHTHADLRGVVSVTTDVTHDPVEAKSLLISRISCGEKGLHLVAVYLQQGIRIACRAERVYHGSDTHGLLLLDRNGELPSMWAVPGEIEEN